MITTTKAQLGQRIQLLRKRAKLKVNHPLMSRMHKPDPKLPADSQDKRTVVVLEPETWEDWLTVPVANARELITVAPAAIFRAGPDNLRSAARR